MAVTAPAYLEALPPPTATGGCHLVVLRPVVALASCLLPAPFLRDNDTDV